MRKWKWTASLIAALALMVCCFAACAATELKITSHSEKNLTVKAGDGFSFSVTAVGDGLSYAWYSKPKGNEDYTLMPQYDRRYNMDASTVMDDGTSFYCVVSDRYGNSVKSDIFQLKVFRPVRIGEQPASVITVEPGVTVSIAILAVGDGLTYKWYHSTDGGESFRRISESGYRYFKTADRSMDGNQIYCVVNDCYGYSVQSSVFTIRVRKKLVILTQPKNTLAGDGETVKLSCIADGDGITYWWCIRDVGETRFRPADVYTSTYETVMSEAIDGRMVYCVAHDKYGGALTSVTVSINMANKAKISVQPKSVTVSEGERVRISLTATGDGLTYEWYYRDRNAAAFARTSTFTGNTYSIYMNDARDGRQVYCVVSDMYGNRVKSDVVTLGMGVMAKITGQPKSAAAVQGATARVTVGAVGDGLTYEWYFSNRGTSKFVKTSAFTGNTYAVTMDASRDGRRLYCIVRDRYGNSVKSDTVTLTMGTTMKITAQPASVSALEGDKVTIGLSAVGDGLTYTWYYRDKGAAGFARTDTFKGNTYAIIMNDARDGRQVYCVVRDRYGNSLKSATAVLSMKEALKITAQPKSVRVQEGGTARVSVAAQGDGLTYTWYFRNRGSVSFVKTSSFTGNTYAVSMDAIRDGRQLYCVVRDSSGSSLKTDVVTISMRETLKITRQPESVTVPAGALARVSVGATGEGLSYTWYYKDRNASSFIRTDTFTGMTYRVEMNSVRAGRQVRCVVRDRYGNTVQSAAATLRMAEE